MVHPGGPAGLAEGSATSWDALRRDLATDVRRVADRLRGLSEARLAESTPGAQSTPGWASRAAAGRRLAQLLADLAAGVEGRLDRAAPTWRDVPGLSDFAVGDQVAVTGQDAAAALVDVQEGEGVWTRTGRQPAAAAAGVVATAVGDTRTRL